jgi:carboxylesterase type B
MRSLRALSALLLAVANAQSNHGASSLPNATDSLTVDVGYGRYRGFQDGGANKWYGVRFAAPPTGNNRFRDPQDPEPFEGVQDATEFGAICPPQQASDYTLSGKSDRFHVDEDCLFLSVTAPSSTTGLKPVHVFIQGGGFTSNSNANYNASDVVTDADIVSVQFVSWWENGPPM